MQNLQSQKSSDIGRSFFGPYGRTFFPSPTGPIFHLCNDNDNDDEDTDDDDDDDDINQSHSSNL